MVYAFSAVIGHSRSLTRNALTSMIDRAPEAMHRANERTPGILRTILTID